MTNLDLLLNTKTDEELKKVGANLVELLSLSDKYMPGLAKICTDCPMHGGWSCDCGSMYYDECDELNSYYYDDDPNLAKFVCKERGYCPGLQMARDLKTLLNEDVKEES